MTYLKVLWPWNKDWWGDDTISLAEYCEIRNITSLERCSYDENGEIDSEELFYDPVPKRKPRLRRIA